MKSRHACRIIAGVVLAVVLAACIDEYGESTGLRRLLSHGMGLTRFAGPGTTLDLYAVNTTTSSKTVVQRDLDSCSGCVFVGADPEVKEYRILHAERSHEAELRSFSYDGKLIRSAVLPHAGACCRVASSSSGKFVAACDTVAEQTTVSIMEKGSDDALAVVSTHELEHEVAAVIWPSESECVIVTYPISPAGGYTCATHIAVSETASACQAEIQKTDRLCLSLPGFFQVPPFVSPKMKYIASATLDVNMVATVTIRDLISGRTMKQRVVPPLFGGYMAWAADDTRLLYWASGKLISMALDETPDQTIECPRGMLPAALAWVDKTRVAAVFMSEGRSSHRTTAILDFSTGESKVLLDNVNCEAILPLPGSDTLLCLVRRIRTSESR